MKKVCIIPARSGSSLKDKNIREMAGKPLLAYSIEQGLASSCERVFVTTDSERYAEIARNYGAEVIMRPAKLAGALATDWGSMFHSLQHIESLYYYPDVVLHLRPTSPIRRMQDIENMLDMMHDPAIDSVRSVSLCKQTPYKMWHMEDGRLIPVIESQEYWNLPRQALPEIYAQNGCIDVVRAEIIHSGSYYDDNRGSMTGKNIRGYICPGWDIDTEQDWQEVAAIMEVLQCFISSS